MAKTYSIDLREKVLSYTKKGGGKREASKLFEIGEATIYRWIKLSEEGSLSPKKRTAFYQKVDSNMLREYVGENPDHTLKQISGALNLGATTVFDWLKRMKITRKKRPRFTKNAMKKNELNLKSSLRA
jgi:transposase